MREQQGGYSPRRAYFTDNWETAEELSPDPFSDVEHTPIHSRRVRTRSDVLQEKLQNQREIEKNEENMT